MARRGSDVDALVMPSWLNQGPGYLACDCLFASACCVLFIKRLKPAETLVSGRGSAW